MACHYVTPDEFYGRVVVVRHEMCLHDKVN